MPAPWPFPWESRLPNTPEKQFTIQAVTKNDRTLPSSFPITRHLHFPSSLSVRCLHLWERILFFRILLDLKTMFSGMAKINLVQWQKNQDFVSLLSGGLRMWALDLDCLSLKLSSITYCVTSDDLLLAPQFSHHFPNYSNWESNNPPHMVAVRIKWINIWKGFRRVLCT